MRQVYLDNHANTQPDERVVQAMLPYFRERYGNAQNMHSLGAEAKEAIETARAQVASLINASPAEIYFTATGSEANNLAVKGVAAACRSKGKHLVVSSIEHFSVLNAAKRLAQDGYEVTQLPVDGTGLVRAEDLAKALRPDTVLVSVQHANPEVGTVQPVAELAKIAHERGVLFHTDAVATAGTVRVDVAALGADLLTLAGSQFYGPKGAAALYLKKGTRIVPQIDGGVQENGRRAGTENVPAIVGFGAAAEIARQEMEGNAVRLRQLRDRLVAGTKDAIEHVYLNGHPEQRLPGNVNFSVEFIEGEGMFLLLDAKGIYVSSGSACASKALKMSHVLTALGVDPAVGQGSLLMTISKYTTGDDIEYVIRELAPIVKKLRDMSPLYAYFQKTGKRQAAGPGTDYEHEHEHAHEAEHE